MCYHNQALKMHNIFRHMEKYPRGRRGSPAKGVVRENRSQGSNPCFSAKIKGCPSGHLFFVVCRDRCFAPVPYFYGTEPWHRQASASLPYASILVSLLRSQVRYKSLNDSHHICVDLNKSVKNNPVNCF